MDWIENVNQVLDYIEENLYGEIGHRAIERIILSPIDVLQRFFMLNAGITLTAYIRRRRLSEAAIRLRECDEKIIDIALRLGYSSPDAFSLAFKRLYGISPSEARSSGAILKRYPRIIFSLSIAYVEGGYSMKSIREMKPFVDEQEIFAMPDVRIIGKAYRCLFNPDETPWQQFWDEYGAIKPALCALPKIIENGMICWTGDSPQGSDHYTYMLGVVCPAGTVVPEGLDYRDLPASYVAKGEYGEEISEIIGKFTPMGFVTCYTDLGWNAELYLDGETDNPPREGCNPFRWLVPCAKVNEAVSNYPKFSVAFEIARNDEDRIKAFNLYQEAFGAKMISQFSPDWSNDENLHIIMDVNGFTILLHPSKEKQPKGVVGCQMCFDSEEALRKAYDALAREGTDYTIDDTSPYWPLTALVTDRYGVGWWLHT